MSTAVLWLNSSMLQLTSPCSRNFRAPKLWLSRWHSLLLPFAPETSLLSLELFGPTGRTAGTRAWISPTKLSSVGLHLKLEAFRITWQMCWIKVPNCVICWLYPKTTKFVGNFGSWSYKVLYLRDVLAYKGSLEFKILPILGALNLCRVSLTTYHICLSRADRKLAMPFHQVWLVWHHCRGLTWYFVICQWPRYCNLYTKRES